MIQKNWVKTIGCADIAKAAKSSAILICFVWTIQPGITVKHNVMG